jgi:3-isopropylmalate/(R)-2-methylmalate dehydratase small subunit
MIIEGRVHKYGNNVDTDVIIPARYLNTSDPLELANHCMEDIDPSFVGKVRPGDIVVGGMNFGCGSSREHAPLAIKGSGVAFVLAKSFARIFFRNAINIGLPILECPEAVDGISDGDVVQIDTDRGIVLDRNTGAAYVAQPFPPFLQKIIAAGGLMASIAQGTEGGKA